MEFFGIMSFVLLMVYLGKFKQLKRKVNRLEKNIKGETAMSQLIKNFLHQSVQIRVEDSFLGDAYIWKILEVDDDWVKIQRTDKKGKTITMLVRIDDIKSIELKGE